jgi:hypothetical protein
LVGIDVLEGEVVAQSRSMVEQIATCSWHQRLVGSIV